MNIRLRFGALVAVCACAFAPVLTACSSETTQSGQSQSAGGAACPATPVDAPKVDRSGEGPFPQVTGAANENPTIAAGEGRAPSGILVKTLTQGDGPTICADDVLTVHYEGALWDGGTVFDSSFDRGTPATFSLNGVIQGWKWGLAGQRVGDRVELVIPAQWGYGEQGSGAQIPPGATLVFVVDIISTLNGKDLSALAEASETGKTIPGVTVTGELASEPKITLESGFNPTEDSLVVLAEGKGDVLSPDDTVHFHGVAVSPNQTDIATTWPDDPVTATVDQIGIAGQRVGSRVLLVKVVNSVGHLAQSGQSGQSEQSGQGGGGTKLVQVLVIDIIASVPAKS